MSAGGPVTTPLARKLAERIARHGPLSIADYVDACLHDPDHGYYRRQPAIGGAADFITAPEISQVFGEIVGLWCAVAWQQMGSPDDVRLIELGPGRGTLMRDALRAIRIVPAFHGALRVELVETNDVLKPVQRDALTGEQAPIRWTDAIEPASGTAILIANEFLDTLPLDQWVHRDGRWRQRRVGIEADAELVFTETETTPQPPLPPSLPAPGEGAVLETRTSAFLLLCDRLAALGTPCAALFVDYGHAQPGYGDTLQAISAHRYAGPLAAPGLSDLTAQVDFSAFAAAARERGFACDGPVPQGEFLGQLGIVERASRLMTANPAKAAAIEAGVARLIAPGGMGSRFQAIGLRSVDLPELPALSPVDTRHPKP